MRQAELNRAVARATGETVSTIKRLGFLLADSFPKPQDPDSDDLAPEVIDWDEFEARRLQPLCGRSQREPALP